MSGKLSCTVLRRGEGSNPFSLVDYASEKYQKLLRRNGFICSMSRKGNCYDNAPMESFWGKLKTEWLYGRKFKTRQEAKKAIFEYIELFYNRRRSHSGNDYEPPVPKVIAA